MATIDGVLDRKHDRYGRIIYVLDIANESVAKRILKIVHEVNGKYVNNTSASYI